MADRETLLSWRAVTPCSTVVSGFWGAEGPAPRTAAFRTYLEGAPGPGVYRFWTRNLRETTRGEGALRLADQPGGFWRVEEAFIADGGTRRDGAVYGTAVPVLFDGAPTRDVTPGEAFFSDAAAIDLPLATTWPSAGRSQAFPAARPSPPPTNRSSRPTRSPAAARPNRRRRGLPSTSTAGARCRGCFCAAHPLKGSSLFWATPSPRATAPARGATPSGPRGSSGACPAAGTR